MSTHLKISPVLYAALGAAFAFYGLFPLYSRGLIGMHALLALAFVPLAALCLFRVLASWPLLGKNKAQTRRFIRQVSLRATAFAAGIALGIGAGTRASNTVYLGLPYEGVTGLTGILLDDPRLVSGGRALSTLSLSMVLNQDGVRASARGEISVFFHEENAARLREFGRGTEVFAEGTLRAGTGGFDGAYVMSADALHITRTAQPLERFRTNLRLSLTQRFTGANAPVWGTAWGGMALALLLGIRDNLDTGITALYRQAGVSYLLALSGMHLAVLIAIISFLLKKPLGLRAAAIVGACIIVVYCFLVGPLPSLIRSAIMYILGVLAVLGMLKREPLSILSLAFLLQLMVTPRSGVSISFILSYAALVGILVIGKLIGSLFKGKIPEFFLQPLSISLGAFIATASFVAWFFNYLRPVGILAGLVLAPLTTLFMVVAMAWLGLDLILPSFSFLLGRPLSLVYWLKEKTVLAASFAPGIRAHPLVVLVVSLLLVALLVFFESRRRKTANRLDAFV